jgi:exosome complex component RRP42
LSNGSARLVGHNLHVLCSVKAEVVHPSHHRPDQGVVEIHVDSLAPTGRRSVEEELEAALSKLLTEHLVDAKALCLVPGQYVWRLHIDLYLLAAGSGSLLDASSHVIRAALRNTLLPVVTASQRSDGKQTRGKVDLLVDGDIQSAQPPVGADRAPVIVTVTLLKSLKGPVMVLDATAEEEACAVSVVHVAADVSDPAQPALCAVVSRVGPLPASQQARIVSTALTAAVQAEKHYSYKSDSSSGFLLQEQLLIH